MLDKSRATASAGETGFKLARFKPWIAEPLCHPVIAEALGDYPAATWVLLSQRQPQALVTDKESMAHSAFNSMLKETSLLLVWSETSLVNGVFHSLGRDCNVENKLGNLFPVKRS